MNFQLSSSQTAKHKWQLADQQQDIQNSMNELRKGIRSNVTEKVHGYNRFFDNSKLNTEVSNSSYVNYSNQPQKESNLFQQFSNQQQQQAQQQPSPPSKRLFDRISYDTIGQQNQQKESANHHHLSQQQSQNSPLKFSHKFYSPRAVPSFEGLQKNLRDHSASKNQQQNIFKNEKSSLTSSLWGDAPQNTQQKYYTQHDRAFPTQSSQSTGSPPRFSQVQKSIETLGHKQQQQLQPQPVQSSGLRGIFDFSQRKMSVQASPTSHAKSSLLSEIDLFKKRDNNTKPTNQSSTSVLQTKLSTSLFSENKKKDTLSESFSLKSGSLTTKNAQSSPRKFSSGSLSNLNSIKRSSLNPSSSIISQISTTPLRRSTERPAFSGSSGLGLSTSSSSTKKLVDRVPITKITEIRSQVENTNPQELASLPTTYVEELTRLAASITKALKNTKFYERNFY